MDGIKLAVSGSELVEHFAERMRHHEQRAAFYEDQILRLEEAGVRDEVVAANPQFSAGVYGSPFTPHRDSAKEHRQRAAYYKFAADHVTTTETYYIDNYEIQQFELEILFNSYYIQHSGFIGCDLDEEE